MAQPDPIYLKLFFAIIFKKIKSAKPVERDIHFPLTGDAQSSRLNINNLYPAFSLSILNSAAFPPFSPIARCT
jgi:hypothetical protein